MKIQAAIALALVLLASTGAEALAQNALSRVNLTLEAETLAVARLDARSPIPDWAVVLQGFSSITRTRHELSVVCEARAISDGSRVEKGWRMLKIESVITFGLSGVLASVEAPLIKAGINTFVISTYETDYVLVKQDDLKPAMTALLAAGHSIRQE